MYGLPNPPAYRIGNRFFNYNDFYLVDALERAVGDAATLPPAARLAGGSLAEIADVPAGHGRALGARPRRLRRRDGPRPRVPDVAVRQPPGRRLPPARAARRVGHARGASSCCATTGFGRRRDRKITAVAEWVVDRRQPARAGAPGRARAPRARGGLRAAPVRLPAAVRRVEAPRRSRLSSGPDGVPPRGRDVRRRRRAVEPAGRELVHHARGLRRDLTRR